MSDHALKESKTNTIPLGEMITKINSEPWDYVVYIFGSAPWIPQSVCATFDPEETEEPDDDPEQAKLLGLTRALSVANAQDVVANAEDQRAEPSMEDLVAAFNFYYQNDAFIEF